MGCGVSAAVYICQDARAWDACVQDGQEGVEMSERTKNVLFAIFVVIMVAEVADTMQ